MFKAIITGISGQDGAYLAKHLLSLGYKVVGIKRRTSMPTDQRLGSIKSNPNFHIVEGDVTDEGSIESVVRDFKPDEFYNLAAQSFVGGSWTYPTATMQITGLGVLNCLEAIRKSRPQCRFYQASSSEIFGNASDGSFKINEDTPLLPESPYAAAKALGHHLVQVYRKSYNIFAVSGILFNHESKLRGFEFVSRKITRGLAMVHYKFSKYVALGNIYAKRDWGHAKDYVRAMHLMLQHDQPRDFVIATGETHSVEEFFHKSCAFFGFDPKEVLEIDASLMRPNDVKVLIGDADYARKQLRWEPEISFDQLVESMCKYDLYDLSSDVRLKQQLESIV